MPITPAQLAAPGDEHAHQKAVFQWIALHGAKNYPAMRRTFAIPNGAKLMGQGTDVGQKEGAKMKAEGLRAGVPDIFSAVPYIDQGSYVSLYHGLFIEMKKPGREREKFGGRSVEQVQWHRDLLQEGYAVATCYGWQAATHTLSLYFSGGLRMPEGGDAYMALPTEAPAW